MAKAIIDKKCKVILIEARTDTRGTMREAVKSLGFTQTMAASSLKEAAPYFEEDFDTPKWVITSLLADDPQNALHLLVRFLRDPKLHNCRLSLVIEEGQKHCLPTAFELGLLSWHDMPFTQTTLANEFTNLLTLLEGDSTQGCWTACEYLRSYLSAADKFQALIRLEEKLISFYPQQTDFILKLAEAQQLAGLNEECVRTLKRAQYLGAKTTKAAKQLIDLIPDEDRSKAESNQSFAEVFGLKTAVLIDTDSSLLTTLRELLGSIGFSQIESFEDGQAAWQWLDKNPEPHLIVQEWRVPKVSGAAILQRCRYKGFSNVPIVILSSLVKTKDQNLLKELGAAWVAEKPIQNDEFIAGIMTMLQQEKHPTSVKVIERKIHLALAVQNLEEANTLRQMLATTPNVPPSTQKAIDAAFAFHEKNYALARTLAFEAFQHAGDSLVILNLIGKIFLKVGAFEESVKCFNKAQELSSMNLERLCLLAEAQIELGDTDSAATSIENAKNVDATSTQVKTAEAKINISTGDTEKAAEIMASLEDVSGIVAYTNNRAVSLAKTGKLKESQEMYQKAHSSLPPGKSRYRAVVLYNLGLSHARSNELDNSLKALSEAAALGSDGALGEKITSLQNRAQMAKSNGTLLQLKKPPEDTDVRMMQEHNNDIMSLGFDLKPGEICAFHIFKYPDIDDKTALLLSAIPEFKI